ncbi:MAG: signal peptidase I, partial [Verrucomicrobia bacterium]|nr:signal peptidase I [Verrucomicrobiota bacterium]
MSPFRHVFWKSYREAGHLAEQAQKILDHQRDLLTPARITELESAISHLENMRSSGTRDDIAAAMTRLEATAQTSLMPYAHASMRENVEGLLTMGIVLFAFRQFFFQPMAIPTGSAQPTFNGITCEDLRYTGQSVPNLAVQAVEWALFGYHYYEVIAEQDGELGGVGPSMGSSRITSALRKSFDVQVGRVMYTVNTSMSEGPNDFMRHMGLANDQGTLPQRYFKKGEPIIRCRVKSGDRLMVDRLTYNFRNPSRGDTVVFKSMQHPGMTANTHYIKRLVGLGGEKVRIGDDRHVVINGQRLDTTTPGFADVYSFDPAKHPVSSSYSGHVNGIGFAEGSWFSTHEAEYELLHSRDASAAQQLSAIAEEKIKVWRGFTNAAWAPTDGSQNGRFAQQKS